MKCTLYRGMILWEGEYKGTDVSEDNMGEFLFLKQQII